MCYKHVKHVFNSIKRAGAGGVGIINLALHQCIQGSIPAAGCMCKWYSQSVLALAGFLRVLRFPLAFKIVTCLAQSKTPPHPGGMGSCCVKKWMLQSKC